MAGASLMYQFLPNWHTQVVSPAGTAWTRATDFPINPANENIRCTAFIIESENSSGGAGGVVAIQFNSKSAPADDTNAIKIYGNGQALQVPGGAWTVWIRTLTSGDVVRVSGGY